MEFPERLVTFRKGRKLTQQQLADSVGVHLSQIRRYESGETQPTLEVIRKLAVELSISADMLIFGQDERGPDDELRLQFEAVCQFSPEEKQVAKVLLESLILRHDAYRFNPLYAAKD
ncbi:MAG: helix-turn-helix transcriptional regulator [Cyanothece sp. SIO1E1]|nr:helix-turn-helix transcriptional regulator [Cyanothece sp. SIO1E1]